MKNISLHQEKFNLPASPVASQGGEVLQIIDANLNRAREGLRIVEEVARFILKDKKLTKEIKTERHKLSSLFANSNLIEFRDTGKDLGKYGNFDTHSYKDLKEIVQRNLRRAQEGCRAIEEFSKLFSAKISSQVKEIRFKIYDLEKTLLKVLTADPPAKAKRRAGKHR
ncbi:thiamine-phosphate pyrophosphorylase [candidate division WOR-3 bacterium]|nr:thiamine-phosphate pyrophosphorylase [candidate division WOR-3 bacterium]